MMSRHVFRTIAIDASLEEVLPVLRDQVDEILSPVHEVFGETEHPIATLHAHFAGAEAHRDVTISHEPLEPLGRHSHRIPFTWHATHHEQAYPLMSGELEFSALSTLPPRSELSFIGHYRPPLGPIGLIGDLIVGHRIAEEAVDHFIAEFSERLLARVQARREANVG